MNKIGGIALLAAAVLQAGTFGPDAAGYMATDQTTYNFEDISNTGARMLAGAAGDTVEVRIGFPFQFYGKEYQSACVSSSGLVGFGGCVTSRDNAGFGGAAVPGDAPAAAPFWGDIGFADSGADGVYYQTLDAAPNRRFIVQWNNAMPGGAARGVTFQAVFYEGSNQILFQYSNVDAGGGQPATGGGRASVGIRDSGAPSNGRFLEWSCNAPVLRNYYAILFAPAVAATAAIIVNSDPLGRTVVVDGQSYTAPKTLNWAVGSSHALSTQAVQAAGTGIQYAFVNWSSGPALTQTIVVSAAATYTATFKTQYQLGLTANPAQGGTVAGAGWYDANTSAILQATENPGWRFSQWSGNLTSAANPATLVMGGSRQVVANFVALQPTLAASLVTRADAGTGKRTVTLRITNGGIGAAVGATLTSVQTQLVLGSGAVTLDTTLPVSLGTLPPGGSIDVPLVFTWPASALREKITLYFSANSGSYSGTSAVTTLR